MRATIERGDVDAALADVGRVGAGGVRPRIDDGARCIDADCLGRRVVQAHGVGNAGQREDGDVAAAIKGVVGDPLSHLPKPLAARPFLGGEFLAAGQEGCGVDDASFDVGMRVEHPQAVDGIAAASTAQVGHPGAVRAHAEGARRTEPEGTRACSLPWEGFGHGPIVPGGSGTHSGRPH